MTTLAFNTEAERRDYWVATAQERGQVIAELVAACQGLLDTNTDLQYHSGQKPGCATCAAVVRARSAIERGRRP